ncbi:MAG TPA: cellulose biosynthesis cyclic di-GMP-binding regulatory protein BcsB, partial [Candidatus Dormibacteraeota bacterium]
MASGVWRARTPAAALAAARAAAAGVAAGLAAPLAAAAALAAAPSPTPSPPPSGGVESAQDVTLEALGVPTQTLYGGANSVAAFFPPPPGALAASGSLLRLVFSHSPLLDPAASTATALVNGQELGTVAMDGSTANGGVADLKVPAGALSGDRANLVEVRFQVRLTGRPAAPGTDDPSAFVRLESQTLLRYQLFVPPGAPPPARLDAYPFPLLTTHGAAPARLGLVLPAPPNPADLAAGFRLVADLGRRGAGQQVAPEAVTFGQLDWLRAGGLPALVVGGL